MAGHVHHRHFEIADLERVAISEQAVKIRSVPLKFGSGVEQFAEYVLYRHDMFANGNLAAELFLQIGRSRQMVGMGMGFEKPLDRQALFLNIGNHLVGGLEGGPAGSRVEIEYAVDYGRAFRLLVMHDIGHRERRLIEKSLDNGEMLLRTGDLFRCMNQCRISHR